MAAEDPGEGAVGGFGLFLLAAEEGGELDDKRRRRRVVVLVVAVVLINISSSLLLLLALDGDDLDRLGVRDDVAGRVPAGEALVESFCGRGIFGGG